MKRILIPIFAFGISFIVLGSCKKDINTAREEEDPAIVNDGPDSNYLWRTYSVLNDYQGFNDTVSSSTYFYDNHRRVIKILDSTYQYYTQTFEQWQTTEYYYNGNDKYPYKSASTATLFTNNFKYDTSIVFYTFNTEGLLIADSGLYVLSSNLAPNNSRTIATGTYQHNGNIITGRINKTITDINGTYSLVEVDTAQTDNDGNIVYNYKINGVDTTWSTITWDNKLSPFSKLSNAQATIKFPSGYTLYNDLRKKSNLLTTYEMILGPNTNGVTEIHLGDVYEYNAAGYATGFHYQEPGVDVRTFYIYQTLQ